MLLLGLFVALSVGGALYAIIRLALRDALVDAQHQLDREKELKGRRK